MKKFNKIVTVIVAFAMIVSSLTMLAIHDEHVHVHAAETVPTGKVWALHDKNANDEYIAFSANNTSPFSFYDVHAWYAIVKDDNYVANVTGNNEQYDGRTFGKVNLSMIDGDTVQVGNANTYEVNKAGVYKKADDAFIVAVNEAKTGNTNTNIAAGEIWGITGGVNTVAVVFTAPETGNYTISETIRRWWGPNANVNNEFTAPSRVTIETANGKVAKVLKTNSPESVSTTINLVKGETVKLFVDNCGNGAGDNYEIEALTATYNGPVNLTVGETFTFSNYMVLPGSANNGKFTMGAIVRDNPTTGADAAEHEAIWGNFNRWGAAPYANYQTMGDYDANQYLARGKDAGNSLYKFVLDGLGSIAKGRISAEVIKITSFTAPADGEYTFSFDCVSYYGCAFFSSVGKNDLIMRTRIDGNGSAVKTYSETVTLKAGEVYNAGFTRAHGDYNNSVNPFTDAVDMTLTNVKMTYNGPIDTYDFLDAHFGGNSYNDGTGVFTVGSRPIDRSAEDVTGIGNAFTPASLLVQDYSRHNDTLKYTDGNYALPIKTAYLNESWTNGTSSQVINNGVYAGTLNGETDSFKVHVSPSDNREVVIAFKAPTCGTFSFELQAHEFYGDPARASLYYVEANGEIVNGCVKETPGNKNAFTFTGTVTLNGGEYIYFAFNGAADGSGANHNYIDKLQVTMDESAHTGTVEWVKTNATHSKEYTCCGEVVEAVEAHSWGTDAVCDECGFVICNTTFDFVANFADLSDEFFTFGVYHTVHNFLMGTTTVWYDGTNESVEHPGSGRPLHGYRYQNSDGYGTSIGYIGSDLVWATGNQMKNVIIFTAPADGTYTYDFEGCNYWGTANSTALYYVEVNGQVHNNNRASFELGLSKAQTAYDFEGTVELKAGETIYFCYDPEESSAGDNGLITKLQVSLVHSGGTATCKDKAACESCGASYGELNANNHASGSSGYTDNGDGTHDQVRACCGEVLTDNEAHTYGANGKCEKCSNTCTHVGGTATCKTQATCTICGQKYGELDASNHEDRNGAWTSDKTGHSFNRTCCDATDVAKTAHNFANGACTVCGYSCTTNTIIHGNVFGSSTTDGYLTYGYVPGDNGGGSIHNRFVAEIAPNGTTLFRQVNGVNCMSIVPGGVGTGYTSVILFTAPVAGTYKLHANFHKWGSGSTVEVGFACPPQNFYKGPGVFSENDVRKEINETITLAAGEKVGFYVRGWAAGNISINSFSITRDAHEGGTATCTDKAVCTVCGLAYGNVNASNHTNTTEFNYESIDANNHKVTYKCCGATKTASEAHNNGNDNVCDNCGAGCNHTGGTATCKTQATCDTCGQKYGNLNANNHEDANGTWTKTQDGHSFNRTCCDATDVAEADHVWGGDNVCDTCGQTCTTTFSTNKSTWGTADVMGNFKFYFGSDWNNVSANFSNLKKLVANGAQLDTDTGKKVFFKSANGDACISLSDQSYVAIVVFEIPVAGSYTYTFNYHKWGTSDSIWVDGGVYNGSWDSDFVTANDQAKIRTGTKNYNAGDKIIFFLRCQAGLNITVNEMSVKYNGHYGTPATCTDPSNCTVCGTNLAGTNASNHTDKNGTWTKDQNGHSFNRTCCDATDVATEAHTYENGVCTECGYTCVHNGGTATCKTQATCSDCGVKYGELNANNHEDTVGTWSGDANGHSFNRTCCDATDIANAPHNNGNDAICDDCGYGCNHTGGTATCKTQATCDTCGQKYGNLNANNHEDANGTWTKTQDGHSFNRTCCDATDVATADHTYVDGVCSTCQYACVHNGGEATCKTLAVCDDCGKSYGSLNANNHEDANGTWTKDQNGHSFNRTCCDATDVATEAHDYEDGVCTECGYTCVHNGGEATCKTQATCSDCGESYGNLDADNHEDANGTWTKDQDGHSFNRTCCDATDSAKADHTYVDGVCSTCQYACVHNGGNATCTDKATCDDCGKEYGDTIDHNYVNGTCTECGDEDPDYVAPSPDTGDNTLAYALLIAGLGLLTFALIPSKKRR